MFKWLGLVGCILALSACAGTSSNVRSAYRPNSADTFVYTLDNPGGMTPEGREVFESRLRERLGGKLVTNDPKANRLEVRIDYYRMRDAAVRFLVGVMAGQDRVQSTVTIKAPDGQQLGVLTVDSKNPTAMFTANGLVRKHADEVADFALGTSGQSAPAVSSGDRSVGGAEPQECESCTRIGRGF